MVDVGADMRGRTDQTTGHLLGGRVRYDQPRRGFRSGIEPVVLAAAVPARPGERVLEGGSGAGAALLCLASRVPELLAVGLERDAALVALANQNAAANHWPAIRFMTGDVAAPPELGVFDHACANPPYHVAAGTPSPDEARQAAKRATEDLLAVWVGSLARHLKPRGTLTLILPSARLPDGMAALREAACGPRAVLPLWPKPGRQTKLLLLQGVKGSREPFRLLPGLVLHNEDGSFTPDAEAILRDGRNLPF